MTHAHYRGGCLRQGEFLSTWHRQPLLLTKMTQVSILGISFLVFISRDPYFLSLYVMIILNTGGIYLVTRFYKQKKLFTWKNKINKNFTSYHHIVSSSSPSFFFLSLFLSYILFLILAIRCLSSLLRRVQVNRWIKIISYFSSSATFLDVISCKRSFTV